jgi:hypothetical protein
MIDVRSNQVMGRMSATGVGLASVASGRGLAYAINTASHELAVIEPLAQTVKRFALPGEPAAVAASENSGSVYVLTSHPNVILRLDPNDGIELGRVLLPDRSGRYGLQPNASDQSHFQGLRARMVLNAPDESVYVTLPEAGSLAVVPTGLFPPLARDIVWVETPDAWNVASIPGVMRPAAPDLPSQPAPVLQAQPATPNNEGTN